MLLIEGGDLACGELLMMVATRVRGLPGGTLIGVATTDPAAPIDLPAWCHLTGHAFLGSAGGDRGSPFVIELAERAVPVDPDRPWHRRPLTEAT